jgi:hypothetical protein
MKRKFKSVLIIFFYIKGIVNKEFVLEGQTVNSAYHFDVLRRLRENVQRILPELWRQKNWLLHHDNAPSHTSLPPENLTENNMAIVAYPPYFSLFSRLKIKLKGFI